LFVIQKVRGLKITKTAKTDHAEIDHFSVEDGLVIFI
jgi:hypothetical protein